MTMQAWQKDGIFFCGGVCIALMVFGGFISFEHKRNVDAIDHKAPSEFDASFRVGDRKELIVGSVGNDIRELHELLIAHGVATAETFAGEEYYGEKTQYYVMLFQLQHDIVPTGEVNQITWSMLLHAPQASNEKYQRVPIDQGIDNNTLYFSPYTAKKAYVTFDVGGKLRNVDDYLAILKKHHTYATFFFTQESIVNSPEMIRSVYAAHHSVGILLEDRWDFTHVTYNEIADNVAASAQAVGALVQRTPWCARPSDSMLMSVAQIKLAQQPMRMMYWDVDPQNHSQVFVDPIVHHVLAYTQPGEVVRFTIDSSSADDTSLIALDQILQRMQNDKWDFPALSCM